MKSAWQEAAAFAARAHQGQLRKDGETPYVSHPFRVALTARDLFGVSDEDVLCAALLHDTIEDTTVDYDELLAKFGRDVADLVAVLSKDSRLPESEREAAYLKGLASASWKARLVKISDVYDNLCDAPSAGARTRALQKAEEVLGLAHDDEPQLLRAADYLRELVGDCREI